MDILENFNNDIKFTKRSSPIPLGARMSYRIAQICLILKLNCSSRGSCSMQKIQTISNALFQSSEFDKLVRYSKDCSLLINFSPRVDPCVNTAIEYAVKYGLCKGVDNKKKYKLTALGRKYTDAILRDNIMKKEKDMLQELGESFTEYMIGQI